MGKTKGQINRKQLDPTNDCIIMCLQCSKNLYTVTVCRLQETFILY